MIRTLGVCICSGIVHWLHVNILGNMAQSLNSGTRQVGVGLPPLFYLLAVLSTKYTRVLPKVRYP